VLLARGSEAGKLLEWKLDFEAGKAQEVAVVGAEGGTVFNGQRGEVGVHDQRPTTMLFGSTVVRIEKKVFIDKDHL